MLSAPSHPYTYADADLILRSSDGVDFRIHRVVLGLASSFFQDFPFDIQQNPSGEHAAGVPVIPLLGDDSKRVKTLLQCAYHGELSPQSSLEDARRLLDVADKYAFSEERMYSAIQPLSIPSRYPLDGYALGVEYMIPPLALASARELLKAPPVESGLQWTGELSLPLFSQDIHQLLDYRARCLVAALSTFDPALEDFLRNLPSSYITACGDCSQGNRMDPTWHWNPNANMYTTATTWTLEYLQDVKKALEECPHEDSVVAPEVLGLACARASECTECRPKASMTIIRFAGFLRDVLKRAIDQVCRLFTSWARTSILTSLGKVPLIHVRHEKFSVSL